MELSSVVARTIRGSYYYGHEIAWKGGARGVVVGAVGLLLLGGVQCSTSIGSELRKEKEGS
jgi:hypothetical protein